MVINISGSIQNGYCSVYVFFQISLSKRDLLQENHIESFNREVQSHTSVRMKDCTLRVSNKTIILLLYEQQYNLHSLWNLRARVNK